MRVYMARQPIFDVDKSLYAYELLYRDNEVNSFNTSVDGNIATRSVISDALTTFGFNYLTNGKYAFINFTKELLDQGLAYMLEPSDVVIEILEDVIPDDVLVDNVRKLKESGYIIALDDYIGNEKLDILFKYVDIIKVDFSLLDKTQRSSIAAKLNKTHMKMLAEKVETEEEFDQAVKDGYTLFQGYYFARSTIVTQNSAAVASSTCMQVLTEVSKSSPNYDALSEIVRIDVNLTYSLLKRINSLEYYRSHRVVSIKSALVKMGLKEIRRWMTLMLIRDINGNKQTEVTRTALVRGVFAETIAEELGMYNRSYDAFTTGMFSQIDVIMQDNLSSLLDNLCIPPAVRGALLGEDNIYKEILDFVKAYEIGDWQAASLLLDNQISLSKASDFYISAVEYADNAFDDRVISTDPGRKTYVKKTHVQI